MNRHYLVLFTLFLCTFSFVFAGGKKEENETVQTQESSSVENRDRKVDKNIIEYAPSESGKPVVLAACSSGTRINDDEVILTIMVNNINMMNIYRAVKTDANIPDGQTPVLADFNLAEQAMNPAYALTGTRIPAEDGGMNYYVMTIWDLKSGAMMASDQVEYASLDEVDSVAAIVLARLFYLIPPPKVLLEPEDLRWQYHWLYVNVNAAGSYQHFQATRISDNVSSIYDNISFAAGGGIDFQFYMHSKNKLALVVGTEFDITMSQFAYHPESVSESNDTGRTTYSGFAAQIPVFFRVNWYPLQFMLSAGAGGYYVMHFSGGGNADLPFGYAVELLGGKKTGPGILGLFVRYMADFTTSPIGDGLGNYQMMSVNIGLFYKLGILQRPQKVLQEMQGGW